MLTVSRVTDRSCSRSLKGQGRRDVTSVRSCHIGPSSLVNLEVVNREEIFTGDSHYECAFVGGPTSSPNKSTNARWRIVNSLLYT